MDNLSSTAGIVAVAAGAVAVIALGSSLGLALALRRVRSAQRVVLGDGRQDLVAHAATLQGSFQALTEYVQDAANRLDARMSQAEHRLDGAVAYRALVRYDAYGDSGRQSTSIALLDATRSGIVLSSIIHRDQARLYVKQVHQGQPELELSPEEDEAIRIAFEGGDARVAL